MKIKNAFIGLFVLIVMLITAAVFTSNPGISFGSAPNGVIAQVSTTTTKSIGKHAATTVYASSTQCTSRIISTNQSAINLSFDTAFTPTNSTGTFQPASTTVAYDSGIYGCGITTAIAETATSTITIVEFR